MIEDIPEVLPDINSLLWIDVNDQIPPTDSDKRAYVKRKKRAAHAGPIIWETWACAIFMSLDNVGYWMYVEDFKN
jgi:hypothetical protein